MNIIKYVTTNIVELLHIFVTNPVKGCILDYMKI